MQHMVSMEMPSTGRSGGYTGGRRSPIGVGGAIAVHALVVGAYLLMPKEMIEVMTTGTLKTHAVPLPPPPPPNDPPMPTKTVKTQPAPRQPTATTPTIPTTPNEWVIEGDNRPHDGTGTGPVIIVPPADPPRAPVLVGPTIDPRALATFQPDYPGAMIRQQVEGSVTVRVTIGPDGRVTDIERLSATDEAFWAATQRHALRKWRFRPATRDGVAVSGTKVLTVHFRLEDR